MLREHDHRIGAEIDAREEAMLVQVSSYGLGRMWLPVRGCGRGAHQPL